MCVCVQWGCAEESRSHCKRWTRCIWNLLRQVHKNFQVSSPHNCTGLPRTVCQGTWCQCRMIIDYLLPAIDVFSILKSWSRDVLLIGLGLGEILDGRVSRSCLQPCPLLLSTAVTWVRRLVSSVTLCECVCPHDKTKTAESTITKLGTGIVHHDTSPTNETRLKGQRSRSQNAKRRLRGRRELCTLCPVSSLQFISKFVKKK